MNNPNWATMAIQLIDQTCELEHHDKEPHQAVEWLVCPIGLTKTQTNPEHEQLAIPICQPCADGLTDSNWALLYCINCNNSQWIYKPHARLHYSQQIHWLKGCPKCTNKFEGLYFNDPKGE